MRSPSLGSSGEDGECWMQLSQSLDYSGDTFESFSEEEESCWHQGSTAAASWCSSEGSAASGSTSGQGGADEQSEGVDPAAVEREVLRKWIDQQNEEAGVEQEKSVTKPQAERREFSAAELDPLSSFCTLKISQICQQQISEQPSGGKARKLQPGFLAEKPQMSGSNCLVPDQLMNRILLKNLRETLKQVTEAQIHESSECPECQEKEAELARITFLRQRKTLLESALIQEKLEEQIYSMDVLTLIGEALRSFPRPSEDPSTLWQRLKDQDTLRTPSSKQNPRTERAGRGFCEQP